MQNFILPMSLTMGWKRKWRWSIPKNSATCPSSHSSGKASMKIWIPIFVRHKPADVAKQSVRIFSEKCFWEEERKRLSNRKHHTNIQRMLVNTIIDIQHTPLMHRPKRTFLLSENIFARRIQMFPNQRHLKRKKIDHETTLFLTLLC